MSDSLTLKWGTLKAWKIHSEAGKAALKRYLEGGPVSLSAMQQNDTPAQKAAIIDLIDALDAETIYNDWEGKHMTKDEAKRYVREYGQRK